MFDSNRFKDTLNMQNVNEKKQNLGYDSQLLKSFPEVDKYFVIYV